MKVIFADTGYWVAVLNPQDQLNRKAGEVARSLGKFRIVTSEMVLDELLGALGGISTRPTVIRGVEKIRALPAAPDVAGGRSEAEQEERQHQAELRERASRRGSVRHGRSSKSTNAPICSDSTGIALSALSWVAAP